MPWSTVHTFDPNVPRSLTKSNAVITGRNGSTTNGDSRRRLNVDTVGVRASTWSPNLYVLNTNTRRMMNRDMQILAIQRRKAT